MKNSISRLCRFAVLIVISLILPTGAWGKSFTPDIRPGEGVTDQRVLSDYFPPLAGTNLDTDVFILDSGKPGVTALLLGGTHGNELAGTVSALVMVKTLSSRRASWLSSPMPTAAPFR